MRSCPGCHNTFPHSAVRCPDCGVALIAQRAAGVVAPPIEPTEDLSAPGLEPVPYLPRGGSIASGVSSTHSTHSTMAESPNARARVSSNPPDLAHGTADQGSSKSQPRARRASQKPQESVGRVYGNYRVLELIGKGGMGWVYRAEHVKLGREVALKLLRPEYAVRRDSVSRFFQEARAVNKIRHRNIVDITDFVELDDGTVFIIMEMLRGQSLTKLMAQRGSLTVPRALAVLMQICDALDAAHAVGIVHRDLKPDNVIVIDGGEGSDHVKLLDFGVAKLLNPHDDDSAWETKAGSVIGTPAYMSPEQAGGLSVDGRSDVYSVGAIMYEMFCGQHLFKARSFGDWVTKHLNETPVRPRSTAGGAAMDERLERIILRCIEKSPDARYRTAGALRDDLLALFGTIETGMVGPGAVPPATPPHLVPTPASGAPITHTRSHLPSVEESHRSAPRMMATPLPPQHAPADARATDGGGRGWLFAGAAVMLGVAAGGAFYLAASGGDASGGAAAAATPARVESPRSASQAPVIEPIERVAPIATAGTITVRFTSEPAGAGVFAAGAGTATCQTPCDLTIDPSDGGSLRQRTFVVRRAGYRSERVTVDLARPPATLETTLRRTSRDEPDPEPAPPPSSMATPPPPDPEPAPDPKPGPGGPKRIDPEDTLDPFQ